MPAYQLGQLSPGHQLPGPAMLIDEISTIVVEPQSTASITANRDIKVDLHTQADNKDSLLTKCDPIQLAIFSHRQAQLDLSCW